jgi:hypothetical protein
MMAEPGDSSAAHGAPPAAGSSPEPGREALYFYGVVRARGRFGATGQPAGMTALRYRDLEALVRATSYTLPPFDEASVLEHQRAVEAVSRRRTVLPAPYGIVFRGRRQLIRMLQDQYIALDEGLSFLDDHWELRLHIAAATGVEPDAALGDAAMDLYAELRRFARAAVPFPSTGRRLASAAFLVRRATWVEFVDRANELGAAHPELVFDVTGPWPPYDFVRVV